MNFLFWNIKGLDLFPELVRLASTNAVDVLVLAECKDPVKTELALTRDVRTYYRVTTDESKVQVFTAFSDSLSKLIDDGPIFAAIDMHPPLMPRMLVIGVHMPSKLHQGPDSQALLTVALADRVRAIEARLCHTNTLLIGDLNMDPFESGVVGAKGLHAVSVAAVANRGSRTVSGEPYDFFYNPSWAHMSDRVDGPPGTYYRSASEHVGYFWHSLDQALLRPALTKLFKRDGLRVLDVAGTTPLMREGRPAVSDHLPILLTLKEEA